MIKIDRNRVDDIGQVIKPSNAWFAKAESEKAAAMAAKSGDIAYKFRSDIYADANEVRPALEKLFYTKCSYCEWIVARADWDVEHFRPKGRVDEDATHPGYYWLAYEWTNLYLGCTYCNQSRREGKGKPALGKRDQFPLVVGSPRAQRPESDINSESCLLIDPCDMSDDPEKYLTFDLKGKPAAIDDNMKGQKSIEVFHLDTGKTSKLRRRKIKDCVRAWQTLIDANKLAIDCPNNQLIKDIIERHTEQLLELSSSDSEFAAVARRVNERPELFGVRL